MNIQDQLALLRRGRFFTDLEEEMSDVLEGVQRVGKSGSVTITLSFGMEAQEEDQVSVKAKIVSKKPQRDPAATIMFIGDDGALTTKDPRQRDLGELMEVDADTGEIIETEIKRGNVVG